MRKFVKSLLKALMALDSIGYKGVPQRETMSSVKEIVRYYLTQLFLVCYELHNFIYLPIQSYAVQFILMSRRNDFNFRSICVKDQFSSILPQLMQLEEGLSSFGLLESIRRFPDSWRPIFIQSDRFQMTADQFLEEAAVEYSMSQILKDLEINTYKVFCDVIQGIYEEGTRMLLNSLL